MFLILLTYLKPLEEVLEVRPRHLEYLERGFADGTFVLAGRRVPPTGGVILAQGNDEDLIRQVAEEDPYFQSGVAQFELIRFHAGTSAPGVPNDEGANERQPASAEVQRPGGSG